MNFLVCQHCGKQYKASRSDSRYCSSACRVAFHRRKSHEDNGELVKIDWRDDEITLSRATTLTNAVPRIHLIIQHHYHRHGAVATKELVDALWRVYTHCSPDARRAHLEQYNYFEIWEHEVEKRGGFASFYKPLMQNKQHMGWLREMYSKYGINLDEIKLDGGIPKPI